MIHGDLGIAPERRFSPLPKTCAEFCAAPSDLGLLIDPMEDEIDHPAPG
jgi:hypothetical protein